MIIAQYTIICDGCGCSTGSSQRSADDAEYHARAGGWSTDDLPRPIQHWCPACTAARKEQP